MEQVLLRTAKVDHGRNKGMTVRLYGEASPFDGTMDRVPAELALCKRMGRVLDFHYPGHPWAVSVDIRQGVAQISIPALLGNWAFILHLDGDTSDQMIVRAGGEILERFHIPRSTIDVAAYMKAFKANPLTGLFRASDRKRIPGQ